MTTNLFITSSPTLFYSWNWIFCSLSSRFLLKYFKDFFSDSTTLKLVSPLPSPSHLRLWKSHNYMVFFSFLQYSIHLGYLFPSFWMTFHLYWLDTSTNPFSHSNLHDCIVITDSFNHYVVICLRFRLFLDLLAVLYSLQLSPLKRYWGKYWGKYMCVRLKRGFLIKIIETQK